MKKALDSVNEKILAATHKRCPDVVANTSQQPRLVAVSKLKPISSIVEAYKCGQRYFGENYIQELENKSNDREIIENCPDIKFHFIGHLQSNKANKLLRVRNLFMVETIDSIKLANLINKAIERHRHGERASGSDEPRADNSWTTHLQHEKLNVMIQVNTSGENQKNGIQPEEAPKLASHIINECHCLRLAGLMTIGSLEASHSHDGPNRDFIRLYDLRKSIANHLSMKPEELELSMGMSSDFEDAVAMGSTNVRVGTMIFGERPPRP